MSGKRILVVDDEKDLIKLIDMRLKTAGYEVLTALDGREGLEMARKEKPDLIILDVMLPKLEGNQVCKMLKGDALYKNIPIIILTGRVQKKDEELAIEAGADSFLQKPFESADLLEKIKVLLERKSSEKAAPLKPGHYNV